MFLLSVLPALALPQDGGIGSVNVSTPSECSWSRRQQRGWITITGGSSGAGSGTVSYSVAANGGAQRSGTISVNGQAFNITQAPNPASCSYSLNTPGVQISEQAGSGSFTLTTGGGCPWTAASNAGWLTITSPTSGSGPATINYSVSRQRRSAARRRDHSRRADFHRHPGPESGQLYICPQSGQSIVRCRGRERLVQCYDRGGLPLECGHHRRLDHNHWRSHGQSAMGR